MNEMDLLTRLRAEVPPGVSPHAEQMFSSGLANEILAERTRLRGAGALRGILALRPAWRVAIATPLVAGLAAAALVATGRPSAPVLTARLLADRAAAAALASQPVRPGQWVYREVSSDYGRMTAEFWATADDRTEASIVHGTLVTYDTSSGRCHPAKVDGVSYGMGSPELDQISYASLRSLPADPRALVSRLGAMPPVAFRCSAACQAFQLIGALLITYVMPPAVAAELFQALGDIPGVTVVHDAADSAGQRGVAFRMPLPAPDPAYEEFVINPRTYRFMGWVIPTDNGPGGKAVIRQALVADPGIRP